MLISLAMFIWPEIGLYIRSLQKETEFISQIINETEGFRMSGFGSRFFGAGIINSLALISIEVLLINDKLNVLEIKYYSSMYVLILVVGTMMSRTTLVGGLISVVACLMTIINLKNKREFSVRQIAKASVYIIAIIVLLLTGHLIVNDFTSDNYQNLISF